MTPLTRLEIWMCGYVLGIVTMHKGQGMLEQEKPRRTIAERIRKKEPKPKKAKTPKKREVCRVEVEPGESRIVQCPRPMLVTAPAWLAEWLR